ncbi:MAG: hypothetical protein ACR2PT_22940 [Endozoicomonas sp.]
MKGSRLVSLAGYAKKLAVFLLLYLHLNSSLAISWVSVDMCLREMNFWSDLIAIFVAIHQQTGTRFGPEYHWPDYIKLYNSVTLIYLTKGEQWVAIATNPLPILDRGIQHMKILVTKSYYFSYLPLYFQGNQTNTLTLHCYADIDLRPRQLQWFNLDQPAPWTRTQLFRY